MSKKNKHRYRPRLNLRPKPAPEPAAPAPEPEVSRTLDPARLCINVLGRMLAQFRRECAFRLARLREGEPARGRWQVAPGVAMRLAALVNCRDSALAALEIADVEAEQRLGRDVDAEESQAPWQVSPGVAMRAARIIIRELDRERDNREMALHQLAQLDRQDEREAQPAPATQAPAPKGLWNELNHELQALQAMQGR
jgi:hypothetical protein